MMQIETAQDIFDTVATHLLTQGQRSLNEPGGCAYRGANGRMCAFGVLIPDEVYSAEDMETLTAEMVIDILLHLDMTAQYAQVLNNNRKLCQDLQDIHDKRNPKVWRQELYNIADWHNLDSRAIDEQSTDI